MFETFPEPSQGMLLLPVAGCINRRTVLQCDHYHHHHYREGISRHNSGSVMTNNWIEIKLYPQCVYCSIGLNVLSTDSAELAGKRMDRWMDVGFVSVNRRQSSGYLCVGRSADK